MKTLLPVRTTGSEAALRDRITLEAARIEAPDVVLGVTRGGRRTVVTGGRAPEPATPREALRYELGSLSKTFTVLLMAALAAEGLLTQDDRLAAHLPRTLRLPHPASRRIALRHLATHTSGLPRIPRDLLPGALLRPRHSGYARYDTERLLRAFATTRPRHPAGRRWNYSNFGVALLGSALARAGSAAYPALLGTRVLRPLGLTGTTLGPGPVGADAVGHRANGRSPLPPTDMGAFAAAGAVRATPHDMLSYLEAHLHPAGTPLSGPLKEVQEPQLHRGGRRGETHTLTWFQHPAPGGPILFHAGATFGQQAFAGYHPASGVGVAAVATRWSRACRLVPVAYELLYALAEEDR
ncbi:beta-lactamase family protein [Streptomyces smyrnaeus]|uniref:Beta-lactamase n=1 Tax=Streptomyces smyrnaeus TaxID=1387713 RepID=A0ABS3Y504_9ACTN|nr:serine hydrolase domain-containing protein [Streptomyces smyrnaeus]MBO8202744.1 beta-lactamase family protein [Streptomyces smyrnaeus]